MMRERLSKLIGHKATLPVAVGVLAFGSGLAVGYLLGRRFKTEERVASPLDSDAIDEAVARREEELAKIRAKIAESRANRSKRVASVVIDADEYAKSQRGMSIDEVVIDEPLVEIIEPATHDPEAEVTVNGEVVNHNIFADADDDGFDMDAEVRLRTTERPYVVHRDEFFEEGTDYNQRQLTYYNGDDTLVDEDNHVIPDHSKVVGEMKFGHGSGDPNVVYIRNEKLKAEYEIFLEIGLYTIDVLGYQSDVNPMGGPRIEHSSPRRFPKE